MFWLTKLFFPQVPPGFSWKKGLDAFILRASADGRWFDFGAVVATDDGLWNVIVDGSFMKDAQGSPRLYKKRSYALCQLAGRAWGWVHQ